jgi:hypothetical protein
MAMALQMWTAKATPDIRKAGTVLFVANFQLVPRWLCSQSSR